MPAMFLMSHTHTHTHTHKQKNSWSPIAIRSKNETNINAEAIWPGVATGQNNLWNDIAAELGSLVHYLFLSMLS